MTFNDLKLSAPLLKAVSEAGYETPSPIQASAIPPVLAGRDLMGCAQTGTGKTAAFALPMLDRLTANAPRRKGAVRALILTPTRELALQIGESFEAYGKYLKLRSTVIFGGVGYAPQFRKLAAGLDILVATPGRLIDHLERQTVNLDQVETLILDEADHMLDMGFAPALKKIVAKIPRQRHTQMFSATMPDNIRQLAQAFLQEPETVMITPPSATADRVEQSLCMVRSQADKRPCTLDLLEQRQTPGRTLIFTRTKHGANRLATFLTGRDYPASAIHGDKSQGTRERMLREFRSGETPILVATDIAARGIDVSDVDAVINYDVPGDNEHYTHRIGRTGRAKKEGVSYLFYVPEEKKRVQELLRLTRNTDLCTPVHFDFNHEHIVVEKKQDSADRFQIKCYF